MGLQSFIPALTPAILLTALTLGWKARGKIQGFFENLVDNHIHTIAGEVSKQISMTLDNQTSHLSNKLDEQGNKIVAAILSSGKVIDQKLE
jgi:hypothetical protein